MGFSSTHIATSSQFAWYTSSTGRALHRYPRGHCKDHTSSSQDQHHNCMLSIVIILTIFRTPHGTSLMRHSLRNASLGSTLTGVYVIVWLFTLPCVARLFRPSGLNRRAASFPAGQLRSKPGRHDVIDFKTAQQTEISCAHTSLCLLFLRLDISWSFSWYDASMGDFTQCRIVRASGYGQLLQFDNGLFSTFKL